MFLVFIFCSLFLGLKSVGLWENGTGVGYLLCGSSHACSIEEIRFMSPQWKVNLFLILNVATFILAIPCFFGSVLFTIFPVFLSCDPKKLTPPKNRSILKYITLLTFVFLLINSISVFILLRNYPPYKSKVYVSTDRSFKLNYPDDWAYEESNDILTFSKKNTELKIITLSPESSSIKYPTICQFPDSKYKGTLISNKYEEFISNRLEKVSSNYKFVKRVYRATGTIPVVGTEASVARKTTGRSAG